MSDELEINLEAIQDMFDNMSKEEFISILESVRQVPCKGERLDDYLARTVDCVVIEEVKCE